MAFQGIRDLDLLPCVFLCVQFENKIGTYVGRSKTARVKRSYCPFGYDFSRYPSIIFIKLLGFCDVDCKGGADWSLSWPGGVLACC